MSNGTERRPETSVRGGGEPPRALSEQVAPVVEALPGLARVAASAAWHTGEWGVRSYVRSAKRLARAATDRDEAAHLAQEATEAAQVVSDLARAVSGGTPVGTALLRAAESLGAVREPAGRPSWPPTRPGSCCCCWRRGRSPAWTCAPAARSGWSPAS